ncbi:hypothetical protein P9112_001010 [Eukaryota sp. TZLM1-RC]
MFHPFILLWTFLLSQALAFNSSMQTLSSGAYCQQSTESVELITNEQQWNNLKRRVPNIGDKSIDFTQHSVLCAFCGQCSTGGHAISIEDVEVSQDRRTVSATIRYVSPPPDAMVTMALTQPFHIVLIPQVEYGATLKITKVGKKPRGGGGSSRLAYM